MQGDVGGDHQPAEVSGTRVLSKAQRSVRRGGLRPHGEKLCRPHYHSHIGRPSIPPGVYFRMLLIGYFEASASQRGIAWRCADSLSLREFLGVP